ncbi:hypothetical protein F53441_9411 [Fusarium austroafricanum]|uniref:Uncharacterized protein n=1 Tax=Fusarium austroafricanum TaxID=2364996 RepID=A0A8H4KCW2_9HYPO|nr:hypothetical protein F53441_9411 [Fusarium austroafricanum]
MKKNDVIAIIIIILFIILAAVSFGIWKLVSMAKNHMSDYPLSMPVKRRSEYTYKKAPNTLQLVLQPTALQTVSVTFTVFLLHLLIAFIADTLKTTFDTMGKLDYSLAGLTEQASKLDITGPSTTNDTSNVLRYQQYPYSRFDPDENKPDVFDKTSPEYRERATKVLNALEGSWIETYKDYQTRRADFVFKLESEDQKRWNRFILNPEQADSSINGVKIEGFERVDFQDNSARISIPSEFDPIERLQNELHAIEKLIETGRRELARLEGSDLFIHLRNEYAKKHQDVIDNYSVYTRPDGDSRCSSGCSCFAAVIQD